MLKKATIAFLVLCILGATYEFTLRNREVLGNKKLLRIAAAGWMISEFKLHEHVRRFHKDHSDVRVELSPTPQEYENILMLQASVGELPYDMVLGPSNYNIQRMVRRKLVVPLDELMGRQLKEDLFPGMLKAAQVDGKTYVLPFMGEVHILNYRTDRFAEAGLTRLPRTWEEFAQCAAKLSFERKGTKYYGTSVIVGQNFFFTQNTFLPLLRSLGGTTVDEQGHLDLTSEHAAEAFRMVKRWVKAGIVSPASLTKDGGPDDYKSGISSMFPNWQSRGFWVIRQNADLADKVGWAPLPEAHRVGSLFAFHGGVILRGTKLEKEAGMFLTEVMMGYAQDDIIGAGKMPVLRSKYKPENRPKNMPDWMIEIGQTLGNSYSAPEPTDFAEMAEFVTVAFQNFLDSDSDDPAPFLKKARTEIERRIYSRRK